MITTQGSMLGLMTSCRNSARWMSRLDKVAMYLKQVYVECNALVDSQSANDSRSAAVIQAPLLGKQVRESFMASYTHILRICKYAAFMRDACRWGLCQNPGGSLPWPTEACG